MSLRKKGISATYWTTISSVIKSLIQVARLSILARILEKEDFGIVAIVTLVLGFTQIFSDLGVSVSLYSRTKVSKKEYSSLFWVSVFLSCIVYGVLWASAPAVASFYEMEELSLLIPVMGLDLIFLAVGRQFRIFREKELRFKGLAIIDITTSLLSLFLAYWLALNGYGVYSIIYSALFASFSASTILVISGIKDHPLLFYVNFKDNMSFYKVGFYQTGTQVLDFLATQLDIIFMGKLMSPGELGVYNLIKQLVLKIYRVVNPIVTKVAIPLLASIKENVLQLKEKFIQLVNIISIVNFFLYGIIAVASSEVLLTLYGDSYTDSANVLRILCFWGAFSGIGSVVSTLIIITGRTDIGFKRTVIRILVSTILILLGAFYFGFWGIVIAQTMYSLVIFLINWKMIVNKLIPAISFREYARCILPYFYVVGICVVCIQLIEDIIPELPFVVNALFKVIILIGAYLLSFWKTLSYTFAFIARKDG